MISTPGSYVKCRPFLCRVVARLCVNEHLSVTVMAEKVAHTFNTFQRHSSAMRSPRGSGSGTECGLELAKSREIARGDGCNANGVVGVEQHEFFSWSTWGPSRLSHMVSSS